MTSTSKATTGREYRYWYLYFELHQAFVSTDAMSIATGGVRSPELSSKDSVVLDHTYHALFASTTSPMRPLIQNAQQSPFRGFAGLTFDIDKCFM